MNWDKKDIVNVCKIVAFGIILYWLLEHIGMLGNIFGTLCNILSPFIVGAAIAFIINIPMTILESKEISLVKKKGKKRRSIVIKNNIYDGGKISKTKRLLSVLLSIIIFIVIIVGIIFLVIPELINVIADIINYLPQLFNNIKDLIQQVISDYPDVAISLTNIQTNLESFNKEIIKELTTIGTSLVTSSFGVITSTINMILDTVISIIFAIYLLMGKEKIFIRVKKIIYAFCKKELADKIYKIAKLSKVAFYNFITGQFTECIILGTLCAIGMAILRLPYSLTVGILVAVTAFIPIVGAMIGGLIGVILLLPVSLGKAITFLIFFIILQQTENNVIYPRVVGNSVGVPGILVLVAVTIGRSFRRSNGNGNRITNYVSSVYFTS